MGLDVNSKHGIIIGVVTILIALPTVIHNFPTITKALSPEDHESEYSPNSLSSTLKFGIFCVLACIFALLLILGIFKKCQWLLVPWMAVELVFSAAFVTLPDYHFDGYQFILVLIGFQAIFLYPIFNLFFEIRLKNAAVH